MASDFERISNSEEDDTRQKLRNLLYLTKKTYEAKGVDIESWLSDSKKIDPTFFENVFKSITSSIWGKAENVLDILSKLYTILGSAFVILIIVQTFRELVSKS